MDLMQRVHNSEFLIRRLLSKLIQFHNIQRSSRGKGFESGWRDVDNTQKNQIQTQNVHVTYLKFR